MEIIQSEFNTELKTEAQAEKRPRGRPRKEKEISTEPNRKVGRPRTRQIVVSPKRRRGHPSLNDMVKKPNRESKYSLQLQELDGQDENGEIYNWVTYDEIFDNYKDLENKIYEVLDVRVGKSTISQIINGTKSKNRYNNILIVKKESTPK